jgi:pimeloyl-ACP methyl ester carboxylesterase
VYHTRRGKKGLFCRPTSGNDGQVPRAQANRIELEYESRGSGEPLVLIMGIGGQLIDWPEGFCDALVEQGFHTVRFDNRDVGLSSKIDGRVGRIRPLIGRSLLRLPVQVPYSLLDMADDTAALMTELGWDSAHVVGVSMGGMIAQTLAIAHPARVRSLTSIMSTTGQRRHLAIKPGALQALLGPPPRSADEAAQRGVKFARICGSTGFPVDYESAAERARRAYERCFHPPGFKRQLAAIMASGSRYHALRFVRTPTAVIHGSADPLIPASAGRATARAVPGARLRIIDGMGHDLPPGVWPLIVDEILRVADRRPG